VLDNVVSYENNVKAVVTKITLGEADAGIVYATDASAAKDVLGILEIPTDLNVIADYPILALPGARQPAWGQTFVDFVLSDAGQQVLERYGFTPVR
jgi:molybdate transport system substrate-binding protein